MSDVQGGAVRHPFAPPEVRVSAPARVVEQPPEGKPEPVPVMARDKVWLVLMAAFVVGVVPAAFIAYGFLTDEKPKDQTFVEYEPLEKIEAEGDAESGRRYGKVLDRARAWRARR